MGWGDAVLGWVSKKLGSFKASGLAKAQAAKTPEMLARDLASSQRAMLGEFAGQSEDWLQRCLAQAKGFRRQQRKALIATAMGSCPDHTDTALRLRSDMDEVERMRCAKAVYGARDVPPVVPPGFKAATADDLAELNLMQSDLTPSGTEFTAAAYVKDPAVWGDDMTPNVIVAFRGSTTAAEDWANNFAQGMGAESDYYRNAMQIGQKLGPSGDSVQIVGHSLGGGLASAAQGASGLATSTYNAAGLHPDTVPDYIGKGAAAQADKIKALRVAGEVLTKTQEQGWMSGLMRDAVGVKSDLPPATSPEAFKALQQAGKLSAGEDYATYLHGMDEVIGAMEQRKTGDEAALKACVGGVG